MKVYQWQKIHIIGGAGSGKTTLAKQLAAQLKIATCVDLDGVAWGPTGKVGLVERETAVRDILAKPNWVTEGVFLWWTEPLFQAADAIIWLDLPFPLRAWRIVRRHLLASWRGDNPHGGLGNLYRFLVSVGKTHYAKTAPHPAGPDDDFAITRLGMVQTLAPYQAKISHCQTPIDVAQLLPPEK
ncbi:MAG: hypothetical protein AAF614_13725 [Chloroflexota bacterium]